MSQVQVLLQGYVYTKEGNEFASSTCTLIEDSYQRMLVDVGSNPEKLLAALRTKNLTPANIDAVFLSHFHPDHWLSLSQFPNVRIIGGGFWWKKDAIIPCEDTIPKTNIRIVPTPGHSADHASLVVKTETQTVAVAGDVFWWADDETPDLTAEGILNRPDPYATDMKSLIESRKKLLSMADYIIPGHGKAFENPLKRKIEE